MKDENKAITVRLSPGINTVLSKEAQKQNITKSELIRRYIQKGIDTTAYETQMEEIIACTEEAVRRAVAPQVERIIKILIKIGKINGSGYYLQLANLLDINNRDSIETVSETVSNCNRLAIKYMSQKDSDVEAFLLNNAELVNEALHLKSPAKNYFYIKPQNLNDD